MYYKPAKSIKDLAEKRHTHKADISDAPPAQPTPIPFFSGSVRSAEV
jgi:hypothetical protein